MRVTGELYDVYFMNQRDRRATDVLRNDFKARTGVSELEAYKKYQHMYELHEKEDMALWDMICEEHNLPRGYLYTLDHFGNIIMPDMMSG